MCMSTSGKELGIRAPALFDKMAFFRCMISLKDYVVKINIPFHFRRNKLDARTRENLASSEMGKLSGKSVRFNACYVEIFVII